MLPLTVGHLVSERHRGVSPDMELTGYVQIITHIKYSERGGRVHANIYTKQYFWMIYLDHYREQITVGLGSRTVAPTSLARTWEYSMSSS